MKMLHNSGIGKRNIIFLVIGLLVLTLGYIAMAIGDIIVSPILLVLSYVVIIPIALLLPKGNDKP